MGRTGRRQPCEEWGKGMEVGKARVAQGWDGGCGESQRRSGSSSGAREVGS